MSELYLAHKLLIEEKLEGLPHLQAELIREWKDLEHKLMLHATMLDEKDIKIDKLQKANNQLERILTYDDNYNGTNMLKIIREARK